MTHEFEELASRGRPYWSPRNLSVFLYPNRWYDGSDARSSVKNALVNLCDQLYDSGAITYWGINLYEGTTDCGYVYDEPMAETYFENFKNWVSNNKSGLRGVHLGVTGTTNFANAEGVSKGETAFKACTKAFVGTRGRYGVTSEDKARWMNLAVQEPCHTLVHDSYHDLTDSDEHDLGRITEKGDSTPMLTFYERDDTHPGGWENDRTGKGNCSGTDSWDETHTLDVTNCTIDAIEATARGET